MASAEIAVLVVWSPSARETASTVLRLPADATVAAALAATHWPALASAAEGDAAFEAAGGIDALRRRGYAGRKR